LITAFRYFNPFTVKDLISCSEEKEERISVIRVWSLEGLRRR
jgi:hypothetical protein